MCALLWLCGFRVKKVYTQDCPNYKFHCLTLDLAIWIQVCNVKLIRILSYLGPTGLTGQKGDTGLTGPAGPPGPTAGGVVYTKWGRTTCPTTSGTQLVYAGRAAGSWWSQSGGGADYLCLPDNPNYLRYTNGAQVRRAYLYGAEYDTYESAPLSAVLNHNVPCAVCYASTRGTVLMIPGKTVCPSSWSREYYGYLMANKYNF